MEYGHFTAMQVRGGATRGLALHLDRLRAAELDVFDREFDELELRARLSVATRETPDASMWVFAEESGLRIEVTPPAATPASPQLLQSVLAQRPVAHLKHSGTFAQNYYGDRAERAGFDETLLVDKEGVISESGVANLVLADADGFVWPAAPHLHGITMQLLQHGLKGRGLSSRYAEVRLEDLPTFRGAFLTNSLGIAALGRVDNQTLEVHQEGLDQLRAIYDAVPWDRFDPMRAEPRWAGSTAKGSAAR